MKKPDIGFEMRTVPVLFVTFSNGASMRAEDLIDHLETLHEADMMEFRDNADPGWLAVLDLVKEYVPENMYRAKRGNDIITDPKAVYLSWDDERRDDIAEILGELAEIVRESVKEYKEG